MNNNFLRNAAILVISTMTLAACGKTDIYRERADKQRELQSEVVESTLKNMPDWMLELPESESAIYQTGSAVSSNLSMSRAKARNMAYGQICVAAGGTVSQQNQTFISDTGSTSVENSELAIRSMCTSTDITGAEIADEVMIQENSRYRTYVLVALPLGEANILLERKLEQEIQEKALERSEETFEEIDSREQAQTSE
jgi:hypothetical protein